MKVEIVCIIDRSGSMFHLTKDAIGGFNNFLAEQKALPGEAKLTLVLFDHELLTPYEAVDLQSVPPLTEETYVPRGNTALYDAIGSTVNKVGARLNQSTDQPDKVIVCILTDGEENSSREFTRERIAEMIKHAEQHAWEFVFLAANQDAFATGAGLNVKACNTQSFVADSAGTQSAYRGLSASVAKYRSS